MTEKELIESGELELYVCGALDSVREREITTLIKSSPAVKQEMLEIEEAYTQLAMGLAPANSDRSYDKLLEIIGTTNKPSGGRNWQSYLGWAASLLFVIGCGYLYTSNTALNNEITKVESQKDVLETQVTDAKAENVNYLATLDALANPETVKVNLGGQNGIETGAVAFYNKQTGITYFDISGLPEAPDNMVYQLWSLTLDPLTPTSLGTLDNTGKNTKLIPIKNDFESQAFGVTLEPAGGSPTPTMEKLYSLGVIKS